jgi:hypothetical protein
LFREHEGKKQLRRSRHRWEDNIKLDLTGIRCDWIELYMSALGSVVDFSKHGNETLDSIKVRNPAE